MPTYDYACKKCGHKFEEFQSMTAPVLIKCPECGMDSLQRLIGAGAGLLFKGSGFYLTDYKKSSSPGSSQGSGNAASGSGTASSGNGKPQDTAGKPKTTETANTGVPARKEKS